MIVLVLSSALAGCASVLGIEQKVPPPDDAGLDAGSASRAPPTEDSGAPIGVGGADAAVPPLDAGAG